MNPSSIKGNDPERWEKLLATLDDKLQLGLLDHLQRVSSYHFEDETLFIQPGSEKDYEYLTNPTFFQQLELFAQDITGAEKVKINPIED